MSCDASRFYGDRRPLADGQNRQDDADVEQKPITVGNDDVRLKGHDLPKRSSRRQMTEVFRASIDDGDIPLLADGKPKPSILHRVTVPYGMPIAKGLTAIQEQYSEALRPTVHRGEVYGLSDCAVWRYYASESRCR